MTSTLRLIIRHSREGSDLNTDREGSDILQTSSMVASLHNERLAWEINPCGDANFEEILTFIAQDSRLIAELKSRGRWP